MTQSTEQAPPDTPWWHAQQFRNGSGPHVQIISLTPEMAAELLAHNDHNRYLNENRRKVLTGAIERGEWMLNNDAVVIGNDDSLLNGQHRCGAILDSGLAVDTIVLFQAHPASRAFMDQGAKRTFADVLHLAGETGTHELAAATRNLYWFEQDRVPVSQNRQVAPTISQLLDTLERHPGIRDAIAQVGKTHPILTRSFAATHLYVFSLVEAEEAEEFMRLLLTGDGLSRGEPIFELRARLIRESGREGRSGMSLTKKSAYVHLTWHAWLNSQSLRLKFTVGGKKPDAFPSVVLEDDDE